ncbi:MAG: hypothetical protein IJR43_11540 [Synergistaceae bacterium]|nr:hypothetical protein [Synergistaceae bacterium]MBQ6112078.1 hypothetical protein [Synergistaceae bacterium]MBQ9629874.1 hypothetical protein [Synergistaceae bacterium]MBR0250139.1 hypothetical protein [Synergistaceae bacterium]
MTDSMKKFAELLSKDEGAKKELEAALAKLSEGHRKASTDAAVKVAAKHGITLTEDDFRKDTKELSADELKAVAGGDACGDFWANFICTFGKAPIVYPD